jgi:hypothetical protein
VARRLKLGFACALAALSAGLAALTGGALASSAPNTNWTALLPPLPSPTEPQPGLVSHCLTPSIACIRTEIERLRGLRDWLGCDHRAVFATTYLELTKTLKRTMVKEPHFFQYPRYLYTQDALFADVYIDTFRDWATGQPVAPAWRIAFETARSGDVNGAQDMLLGINAHVQNDMPFVIAALGLRTRSGATRKVDHDRVNEVLNRAYGPVVHAVARRYDDRVSTTNSDATPLDDAAGLELTRTWREEVWRNAERLVNASSDAERAQIAQQIEANAAAWARMIATPQTPGDRARRDAYCRAQLGG